VDLIDSMAEVLREHGRAAPGGNRCAGCDQVLLRDIAEHQAFRLLQFYSDNDMAVYDDRDVL
jgi:hypothetical protein